MSDSQETDLPNFSNPPIVETVLSIQFERLAAMRSVHFGLFWRRVQSQFPNTEERPPLDPIVEQAVRPIPRAVQVRFEAVETLRLPRFWLLNTAGTEMIQIQNDRFIKNWRKHNTDEEYPRYEKVIKPAFERDVREFIAFIEEEKLGGISVTQCEVTYVNHIVAGEGWDNWGDIAEIFTFWKQPPGLHYPGRVEDFVFHAQFPILGPTNEWIGRLHVEVQPAHRIADGKPMYAMNLTARGMLGKDYDFFDIGRRAVVKSFEHLTTKNMHRVWGKK
ncbi:MAG: TIGR04255 family protein [Burkholderiales bacterium]